MNAFLETIQSLLSGAAPTKDQWISLIGTLSKVLGSFLVTRGAVSADSWETLFSPGAIESYAGVAFVLTPFVLDMLKHSISGQVKTAKALPPAEKVEVAQTLPPVDKIQVAETLPDGAKLQMVEAMPDVKSIVARPTATDGVAAAVKDTSRPKVVNEPPTDNSNMIGGLTEIRNLGINQSGGQPSYRGSGDRYINQGDK